MTAEDRTSFIDEHRTVCLCSVGQPDYLAATAIRADGRETLVLAAVAAIGDEAAGYDAECRAVAHDQLGPLPDEFVARISSRTGRCGRRTQAGTPCKIRVPRPGAACEWHRAQPAKPNHH